MLIPCSLTVSRMVSTNGLSMSRVMPRTTDGFRLTPARTYTMVPITWIVLRIEAIMWLTPAVTMVLHSMQTTGL